ncbi:crossover junction endodeoxyribonuclease RuvC [Ammoniphilus sp. CFH 90114]|uniref:crossover junction endodeoxyribonuclease RuvC n=1 Tax=Ammoniphilus sp. CFH 90114 TaxID=2493665 RepID=UPI00100FDFE9|nr:crossover junction endodeoxyribonuclease RuvC [Ammoniphilus sp. CFH 90114]RXT14743.1 crossover junction endodeoxyribonuclease RuvC [Ammoniphilus sp. CFH 90114]
MRIIGIDPGIAIVGYGIIEKQGNRLIPIQYGCIKTEAHTRDALRLKQIYDAMTILLKKYQPEVLAVEKLFFNRNVTTAFSVGQARGVIVLAGEEAGIPLYEYTPLQVKQSVVGYGQAEKKQIQEMVRILLSLQTAPKPDDVADALGVAITHAHSSHIHNLINGGK